MSREATESQLKTINLGVNDRGLTIFINGINIAKYSCCKFVCILSVATFSYLLYLPLLCIAHAALNTEAVASIIVLLEEVSEQK